MAKRSSSVRRPVGPVPDQAMLHAAALAHLARFAAGRTALTLVLDRRIERWLRAALTEDAALIDIATAAAAHAREVARAVVERLAACGVVDDARFAETRARSLVRSGRSLRAVSAHLAARGIDVVAVTSVLPRDSDLAAALVFARRRRLGPFRAGSSVNDGQTASILDESAIEQPLMRELAAMARAGFSQPIARQALAMDVSEAEERIAELRRA